MNTQTDPSILNVDNLRAEVYTILLLEYSMNCRRVPPGLCVMHPPQTYNNEHSRSLTQAHLLEHVSNSYIRMMFMLRDDYSNAQERLQVESYVPLIALKKWLPQIDVDKIVRMRLPENMDMHKHLYLMNECLGRAPRDDAYCYFLNQENMDKFKRYMGIPV